ncbi:5218_t:CDS:1, partial [Gigaspora margarita]
MDKEKFKEWKQDYTPKENINIGDYEILSVEISQAEMIEIIRVALLHKATGQTMISNEMLKKLPTKGYE